MITSSNNKVVYTSDGTQTEYFFDFMVYDVNHIKVYIKGENELTSSLLDSSNYTVTLNSDYSGGKITLNSAQPSGTEITIVREVPITQEIDYIEGDPFPANSHERALDLLTMVCQQLSEKLARAILRDITKSESINADEFLSLLQFFQDHYDEYINSFNEIYLGAKDSFPSTRNDGTPLQKGDLYFDTTKNGLYVWDGTQWVRISQETFIDGGLLKIWDESSQAFVSSNADKVDGFHASQTPTANTIPVADSNGYINDWIKQGEGSGLNADLLRSLPADFTCSKNTNGYTKLPNGLIVQWGSFKITGPGNGGTTSGNLVVNFPITFPNALLYLGLSQLKDGNYGNTPDFNYYTWHEDTSSFTYYYKGADTGWGYIEHWWIAIGY